LTCHLGGRPTWEPDIHAFVPTPGAVPGMHVAGACNGIFSTHGCLAAGVAAAKDALEALGRKAEAVDLPQADDAPYTLKPLWAVPGKGRAWLDFQNDICVKDVQQAAAENFRSVEHMKRYTTQGMAPDQGKNSNVAALAVLADATGRSIAETGTTTFRPPYHPISMGAIGGEARGEIFQPVRKTPIYDWNDANGADWEPVGQWRRPFAYCRSGESRHDAVNREVKNTRENLGLLDASTLGKLIVKGPDAGKFLDMMYTNMMSNLKVGKCRYGLMCSENGFLMDDGVVARIDEDTWLCHTTTGGAESIHGWMEDWLQCEWWDWKVYVANVTEQYAQVAVVGPKARKVLEKINTLAGGGMDLSKEALPFMEWRDGKIGGFNARAYRISFSGQLSYEIAVAASEGQAFWDALMAAGKEFNVMPYGTETLHILRAEKGFIMIGDETDGTVIPQDLNLNWA
ncbi:MAG: sarcosine oxidase subunit alpha family protein, partial [Alphaproteobacteria bacterium]